MKYSILTLYVNKENETVIKELKRYCKNNNLTLSNYIMSIVNNEYNKIKGAKQNEKENIKKG